MNRIELKPATYEAIAAMRGEPEHNGRAVMAIEGGKLVGVGGVDHVGDVLVAWIRISPELRRRPHWIGRHIEAVLSLARGRGLPVFAECDPTIPGSERLLRFAGFCQVDALPGVWLLPE